MSPRRVGSGTATGEADACAVLLAAHFAKDHRMVREAEAEFDAAYGHRTSLGAGGGRGYTGTELSGLLAAVPGALGLRVESAEACGVGEAGDVLLACDNRRTVRIEIKAQLTLPDFTWIQSADWIRDQTDFLAALLTIERRARQQISKSVAYLIFHGYEPDASWDLGSLWAADVAGLTTSDARERHGVANAGHLMAFLQSKYLLHITMEGLRMFQLAHIPNLTSALQGGLRYALMPPAKASQLRIRTRGDGQQPRVRGIHLTYFLGQRNRPVGGHHMHDPFFDGATPLLLKQR
jgi:hypothetical protein